MIRTWPNTYPSLLKPWSAPSGAPFLARLSWTAPAGSAGTAVPCCSGTRDFASSALTATVARWGLLLSVSPDLETVPLSFTDVSAIGCSTCAAWVWSALQV